MITEDKLFDKADFTQKRLAKGDYEYCHFLHCNFSNANLSECRFLECTFDGCNLSNAILGMTVFRDIQCNHCKMLGMQFEHCSEFGFAISFTDCILNHCSFFKRDLKNTAFKNCSFIEADFTEANCTAVVFDNCDLKDAKFEHTVLEKSDFSSAYNFTIDPEKNRITKALFSLASLPGLLAKYTIDIKM